MVGNSNPYAAQDVAEPPPIEEHSYPHIRRLLKSMLVKGVLLTLIFWGCFVTGIMMAVDEWLGVARVKSLGLTQGVEFLRYGLVFPAMFLAYICLQRKSELVPTDRHLECVVETTATAERDDIAIRVR